MIVDTPVDESTNLLGDAMTWADLLTFLGDFRAISGYDFIDDLH